MSEENHTPGPWRWEVNLKSKRVELCGGKPQFDLTVLNFSRWGMNGAKVEFLQRCKSGMLIEPCEKFAVPIPGREHHADWCQTINHPDANLIASAPDLLAERDQLRRHNAELLDAIRALMADIDTLGYWIPNQLRCKASQAIATTVPAKEVAP